MTKEAQTNSIRSFLYHLSPQNENFAAANRELKKVLEAKVNKIYSDEYEKIKKTFKNNK